MTDIEWVRNSDGSQGKTWNPVTGCDKISPGCGLARPGSDDAHTGRTGGCYALALAGRLKAMGQEKYQHDGNPRTSGPGFAVTLHPAALTVPLRWRKPQTVFVNSMSDIGHAKVSDGFIARIFAVMASTPQHTFQVLTKRPRRLARLLADTAFLQRVRDIAPAIAPGRLPAKSWPLPNVWMGTSIETDEYAWRAEALRQTPAAVRFLSCEPLLGPLPSLELDAIDWVIAGGESGPKSRPVDLDWVRQIRDHCLDRQVSFFFKQVGGHTAKAGGRMLDGRTWEQMPVPKP